MVTSELDKLYKSVLAEPYEDTIRLVYADALQDMCDDSRAEFIRLQVADKDEPRQLELLRSINYSTMTQQGGTRHYRNWECWFKFRLPKVPCGNHYRVEVPNPNPKFTISPWMGIPGHATSPASLGNWAIWEYNRGFISKVSMHWELWKHHANELLRCEPITNVKLTSLPPVTAVYDDRNRQTVFGITDMVGTVIIHQTELSIGARKIRDEQMSREMLVKLLKKNWPSVKRWEVPDVA